MSKVVNVNLKDKNGWTALHLAGKHGNVEGFSNLLALGADIFAENTYGENVFHIACRLDKNVFNEISGKSSFPARCNQVGNARNCVIV